MEPTKRRDKLRKKEGEPRQTSDDKKWSGDELGKKEGSRDEEEPVARPASDVRPVQTQDG
jgi:hypothetical protein